MAKQKGGVIVDVGNVIIAHWLSNTTPDSFRTLDYTTIPEVPGVFDSLKRFNDTFGGNVTAVYKATDIADEKIVAWLAHHRFTVRTGIPFERVFRTKGGRDKTVHMDQSSTTHCGTTVVVDDRLEVMSYFVGKVPNLFLFRPQQQEVEQWSGTGAISHVHVVQSWQEIENILNNM
jgi:hypothetical protein